jgi:heme A synthase
MKCESQNGEAASIETLAAAAAIGSAAIVYAAGSVSKRGGGGIGGIWPRRQSSWRPHQIAVSRNRNMAAKYGVMKSIMAYRHQRHQRKLA